MAAFHSIELCFLLLADFISDKRTYVSKRPRVEMVANDIRQQCILLTDIVDGELEEEGVTTPATLTQNFPFPACPPTTPQASLYPPPTLVKFLVFFVSLLVMEFPTWLEKY